MPLESGDFIPDLNLNNPLGSDPKSEGDDHIRLVKRCTQQSFGAFVGTQATPKSVSLTEDQINDAALKSESAAISASWTFSGANRYTNDLSFDNDTFIFMDTLGNAQLVRMMSVTAGNVMQFGSNQGFAVNGEMLFAGQFDMIRGGSLGARFVAASDGGMLVGDRLGGLKKTGFRNPQNLSTGTTQDLNQDWEGTFLNWTGGTLTVPILQANTTLTIVNSSATVTRTLAEGSGVNLIAYVGGSTVSGNLSIAPSSVIQVYYFSSTEVRVWGQGVS